MTRSQLSPKALCYRGRDHDLVYYPPVFVEAVARLWFKKDVISYPVCKGHLDQWLDDADIHMRAEPDEIEWLGK